MDAARGGVGHLGTLAEVLLLEVGGVEGVVVGEVLLVKPGIVGEFSL
jgi:hypothetical protein